MSRIPVLVLLVAVACRCSEKPAPEAPDAGPAKSAEPAKPPRNPVPFGTAALVLGSFDAGAQGAKRTLEVVAGPCIGGDEPECAVSVRLREGEKELSSVKVAFGLAS